MTRISLFVQIVSMTDTTFILQSYSLQFVHYHSFDFVVLAMSRSDLRSIFPDIVLGICSTNSTPPRSFMYGATCPENMNLNTNFLVYKFAHLCLDNSSTPTVCLA